jgi:DNA primase
MGIKIETDILPKLNKVKRDQNGWTACCPAHDDKNPSLAIAVEDKKILFKCFAGCSYKEIVQALGLFEREQTIKPKFGTDNKKEQIKIVATYDYQDEDGNSIYQSVRFEPKTFKIRRPDGNGNWIWNLQGIKRVPYHLPELIQAKENNLPVIICEGEKDVDNVREKLDFVATTTAQGSNAWSNDYTDFFDGLDVMILPDNDQPGRKYANDVALSLWGIAKSVKIIQLPI